MGGVVERGGEVRKVGKRGRGWGKACGGRGGRWEEGLGVSGKKVAVGEGGGG